MNEQRTPHSAAQRSQPAYAACWLLAAMATGCGFVGIEAMEREGPIDAEADGQRDAFVGDAPVPEGGAADALVADALSVDGGEDGSALDASSDTGSADTGSADTGSADTGLADAGNDAPIVDAGHDVPSVDAGSDPMCGILRLLMFPTSLPFAAPSTYGTNHEGAQPFTVGYQATVPFTVRASDFRPPDDCPACLVRLQLRGTVTGLSKLGSDVRVESGASFRMRFNVSGGTATIYFEEVCTGMCGGAETLCPSDEGCYPGGTDACLQCFGRSPATCACVDAMQLRLPDGTVCSFGAVLNGRCVSGECVGIMM